MFRNLKVAICASFFIVLIFICFAIYYQQSLEISNKTHSFVINVKRQKDATSSCNSTENNGKYGRRGACKAPRVSILVSSLPSRYLQLFWDIEQIENGDWIGLFDQDPTCSENSSLLYQTVVQTATGWVMTDAADHFTMSGEAVSYISSCSKFWAAYLDANGKVITSSCLKTNPTWMYDMRHRIRNIQLRRLFIPGTHNSGSYGPYNQSLIPSYIVEKYIITQDEDILGQLLHGVRYLDLRVSLYSTSSEIWWINHGPYSVRPLAEVLEQIKQFLRNTEEILILDFHEFPAGFDDHETHRKFATHLKSELSEWIAPVDWTTTCGYLWSINKTLMISYNNLHIVKEFPSMFAYPVSQKWANAQNVGDLETYLRRAIEKRPPYMWAAMAELTSTVWSIVSYKTAGIREMAHDTNLKVTTWFRGQWGRTCNIIAVDFIRSTDIVQTGIEWNSRRSRKTSCDYE